MIDEEGQQLGILSLGDALAAAAERGVDLVEVSPDAAPPVCRLMDYGKYKYQTSKRASEAKKKQVKVEIKEVKMRPKTDQHDFEFKVKNARRFIEEGNKVKLTVMFRGRENTHPERGEMMLTKAVEALKDVALVEAQPMRAGRAMSMVLAPSKK